MLFLTNSRCGRAQTLALYAHPLDCCAGWKVRSSRRLSEAHQKWSSHLLNSLTVEQKWACNRLWISSLSGKKILRVERKTIFVIACFVSQILLAVRCPKRKPHPGRSHWVIRDNHHRRKRPLPSKRSRFNRLSSRLTDSYESDKRSPTRRACVRQSNQ